MLATLFWIGSLTAIANKVTDYAEWTAQSGIRARVF